MEIDISKIKFNAHGLVPAIVQEESGQVLMLAYMNEESLKKTIETGYTHFYSRSRQTLWKKGETSGNVQQVKELYYDCDGDAILVKVHQTGVACHTGTYSCFSGRRLDKNDKLPAVVEQPPQENLSLVLYEMGDLWYHCLVLLAFHGIKPENLFAELMNRRKGGAYHKFTGKTGERPQD